MSKGQQDSDLKSEQQRAKCDLCGHQFCANCDTWCCKCGDGKVPVAKPLNDVQVESRTCMKCGHEERFSDNEGGFCEKQISGTLLKCDCYCEFPASPVQASVPAEGEDNCQPRPDPRCNDHLGASPMPQCVTAVYWAEQSDLEPLATEVVKVCNLRGWSLHWTERGAYLFLEASEFLEAVRGKRGDITKEAADILFVLLSILQPRNIAFGDVVDALRNKVAELKIKPHYAGEQFTATPSPTTLASLPDGPRSNREPHMFHEHPLYPDYCSFAVGDEDYCKREANAPIHIVAATTSPPYGLV